MRLYVVWYTIHTTQGPVREWTIIHADTAKEAAQIVRTVNGKLVAAGKEARRYNVKASRVWKEGKR